MSPARSSFEFYPGSRVVEPVGCSGKFACQPHFRFTFFEGAGASEERGEESRVGRLSKSVDCVRVQRGERGRRR